MCHGNRHGNYFGTALDTGDLSYVKDAIIGTCHRTSDRQEHKVIQLAGPERDVITIHLHATAYGQQGTHRHNQWCAHYVILLCSRNWHNNNIIIIKCLQILSRVTYSGSRMHRYVLLFYTQELIVC